MRDECDAKFLISFFQCHLANHNERDQSRDETGNFRDRCNLLAREPSYAHHESDEKTKNSAWQEPADEPLRARSQTMRSSLPGVISISCKRASNNHWLRSSHAQLAKVSFLAKQKARSLRPGFFVFD